MQSERFYSVFKRLLIFVGVAAFIAYVGSVEARSAALEKVIKGANQEGSLVIEWLGGRIGDHPGVTAMVNGMNKRYGTNIRFSFTPGPAFVPMLHKVTQEWRAGQPSSSDIYLGTANQITTGLKSGVLRKLDWAAIVERPVPRSADFDRIATQGAGIAMASRIVGITYNTQLVKGDDIPKTMEDVFKPKWKGRIASTPMATGFYQLAAPDIKGYQYMKDYMVRLAKHIGGLLSCADVDRVASGEFAMMIFDCGHDDAVRFQRRGAPVGHTTDQELVRINIIYFGIPEHARHPNAGILFTNFLHTEEGQKLQWEYAGHDLHIYPESQTAKMLQGLRERRGKLFLDTVQRDFETGPEEASRIQAEFGKILQAGGR